MAPASNSPKTLQQNRPRATVPRAIVPAIPLPYIQKRKQQQAAREKASEEPAQATQAAVVESPPSPTPPLTKTAPSVESGAAENHVTESVEKHNDDAEVEAATAPVFEVQDEVVDFANGEPGASVEKETMGKLDCSFWFMAII